MKRRNKVNPEFSMSSLTDIIFLLLIFFMLTSSVVQINFQLPESDSKTVAPSDYVISMTKDGTVKYNGKVTKFSSIQSKIAKENATAENNVNATVSIIAEVGVPWQKVNEAMSIANRLKMRAIINTQPRK